MASMWRSALMLAFTLAACGRTGIDSAADQLVGDAATGADTLSPRSCLLSFAAKGPYATGVAPVSIVIADFDRDGRLDLATSNWGGATGMADGSVSNT